VRVFFRTLPLATAFLGVVGELPKADLEPYSSPTQVLEVAWFRNLSCSAERQFRSPEIRNLRYRSTGAYCAPATALPAAPILFDRNSLELNTAGSNTLQRAAAWLSAGADSRVLIVGSCDTSGSESFTHTLAETGCAVVRKFL
jgi:outer membrane protein OmpA-like peptidoglycan-associated protein